MDIILNHHEKFNGSGYPYQLAGKEISLLTQIVSLSDSFDKLTTLGDEHKSFHTFNIMKNRMQGNFDEKLLVKYIKMFSTIYYN